MTVIAAVQAEPVWLDLQGGVEKTIALIKKAGADGVNVLGFPEVFIPGYPWSIWTTSVLENVEFIHKYMNNSMVKESPEMDGIREAVKEAGIFVVLGYSERDGGSLYISQSFINPEGKIVLHRRKIKPTHVERSIWGDGQADSLICTADSPFGKIGGLNCWEHMQPLLRYYEYSQGVQIHVAGWPPVFDELPAPWPFHVGCRAETIASQNMAMEGACFVIVATQVLSEQHGEITKTAGNPFFKGVEGSKGQAVGGGGFAMIFAPDGRPLCEPLEKGEEGILTAKIDLSMIDFAKQMLDVVGHYSRPDLLSLLVKPEKATQVTMQVKEKDFELYE